MNVLLLGSGGREHALAWKLAQSPTLTGSTPRPAIPASPSMPSCVALDHRPITNAVVAFARDKAIGLVVVGPEQPLVDGLADRLRAAGIPVFGPTAAAARLEGSKGFTKDLCARAGHPDRRLRPLHRSRRRREAALDRFGLPVVIKADGLAAGKGVVIAETRAEAEAALADMFAGGFGGAGAEVVIEEFLDGEEASFFALTDGDDDRAVRLGAGSQARRRGRYRPEHRRHGRLQPRAPS